MEYERFTIDDEKVMSLLTWHENAHQTLAEITGGRKRKLAWPHTRGLGVTQAHDASAKMDSVEATHGSHESHHVRDLDPTRQFFKCSIRQVVQG
jgi:hypothetical protein